MSTLSDALNDTCRVLTDSLAVLTIHTDTAVQTVMGSRQFSADTPVSGGFTAAELKKEIVKLGPIPGARTSPEVQAQYMTDLANSLIMFAEAERVTTLSELHRQVIDILTSHSVEWLELTEVAKATCQEHIQDYIANSGRVVTPAQDRYEKEEARLVEVFKEVDACISAIATAQNFISEKSSVVTPEDTEALKWLKNAADLKKIKEDQLISTMKRLHETLDGVPTGAAVKAVSQQTFNMPHDLNQHTGQKVVDSWDAFKKGKGEALGLLNNPMARITEDYNFDTGACWMPSTLASGYAGFPKELRGRIKIQSETLYYILKPLLTPEISARLHTSYKTGINHQFTGRCDVGDGMGLYYALVSVFRSATAAYQDALAQVVNNSYIHFEKGQVKTKITFLREKLSEVITYGIPITWQSSGRMIVQTLQRRYPLWNASLQEYFIGPTQQQDVYAYMGDLLAMVETLDERDRQFETNGKRQGFQAHFSEYQKDQRYRDGGGSKGCGVETHSYSRPDNSQKPNFGGRNWSKGPPAKGGGNKGMRSVKGAYARPKGKGTKGDGPKGAKGKGRNSGKTLCKAVDCQLFTPHCTKILCTKCFKDAVTKGELPLKDGSKFTALTNRKRPMAGSIEAILEDEELPTNGDDIPGPACSKRPRITQRVANFAMGIVNVTSDDSEEAADGLAALSGVQDLLTAETIGQLHITDQGGNHLIDIEDIVPPPSGESGAEPAPVTKPTLKRTRAQLNAQERQQLIPQPPRFDEEYEPDSPFWRGEAHLMELSKGDYLLNHVTALDRAGDNLEVAEVLGISRRKRIKVDNDLDDLMGQPEPLQPGERRRPPTPRPAPEIHMNVTGVPQSICPPFQVDGPGGDTLERAYSRMDTAGVPVSICPTHQVCKDEPVEEEQSHSDTSVELGMMLHAYMAEIPSEYTVPPAQPQELEARETERELGAQVMRSTGDEFIRRDELEHGLTAWDIAAHSGPHNSDMMEPPTWDLWDESEDEDIGTLDVPLQYRHSEMMIGPHEEMEEDDYDYYEDYDPQGDGHEDYLEQSRSPDSIERDRDFDADKLAAYTVQTNGSRGGDEYRSPDQVNDNDGRV